MELLYDYQKKLKTKKGLQSELSYKLSLQDDNLCFKSNFLFNYNTNTEIRIEHKLDFNIVTGDFLVCYVLKRKNETKTKEIKIEKKNDFKKLSELIKNGIDRGEKSIYFWGSEFVKQKNILSNVFLDVLKHRFDFEYFKCKNYEITNEKTYIYDLLVDYHLDKNKIKGHNNVYDDIQFDYPKSKWLKRNDYKFLPAVLDSYNIKSQYMIKELNKERDRPLYIKSVNYLCKLFGEDYHNYLQQIDWKAHCFTLPPNNKTHELKNKKERINLIKVIKTWGKSQNETILNEDLIVQLNSLFSIRDKISEKYPCIEFDSKNDSQFDELSANWRSIKKHLQRGYKERYLLPENILETIEDEIVVNNMVFKPRILLSEDDFIMEGKTMKNCMSKQFTNGLIFLFISMKHKKDSVNLQYRKGMLVQSYAKANTPVPELFNKAIEILNTKMRTFSDLTWKKEHFDFIF